MSVARYNLCEWSYIQGSSYGDFVKHSDYEKLEKEVKEMKEMLDNVRYWETCPKEYIDRIDKILKDKPEMEGDIIDDDEDDIDFKNEGYDYDKPEMEHHTQTCFQDMVNLNNDCSCGLNKDKPEMDNGMIHHHSQDKT